MAKILFIGFVWPEPSSSAAGWRILHLVKLLLQHYEVHFASSAVKTPYSFDLRSLGVYEHQIVLNDSSFDVFVRELEPIAVVFDRFMVEEQYGWRVAENAADALRILDTEDLHFLRKARQQAYNKNQPIDLYNDLTKREIASILRSDLSLIISEYEINLLIDTFKIDKEILFYLPFQEHPLEMPIVRKTYEERANFVFIGNFIHEPNWRTVEVLKREIWPMLRRQVPKAEIHIYGAYATEKVNQLHNIKEGFIIKGRAEDARSTIETFRVLLAPIPFGAGAKGKFVDAMYAGTASVTSSVGAENMLLDSKWAGFVADEKEDFVNHALMLYNDRDVWYDKQELGYTIFNATVANNSFSEDLLAWINMAIKNVVLIRNNNFLGQILQQQQLNATKYMSMWIEAKNKLAK